MTTEDPHNLRKSEIEDAMISRAEEKSQIAAFGKSAYEGYRKAISRREWTDWKDLPADYQCIWVAVAQAVLDEARRVGWL